MSSQCEYNVARVYCACRRVSSAHVTSAHVHSDLYTERKYKHFTVILSASFSPVITHPLSLSLSASYKWTYSEAY